MESANNSVETTISRLSDSPLFLGVSMGNGELLCQAVETAPSDVTLVLAFADYLEESGWVDSGRYVRGLGVSSGGDGSDGSGGDGNSGFGDGSDGGFGDGSGFGAGSDGGVRKSHICAMRYIVSDNFYILCIAGGYSSYVLVGWVKRRDFLLEVTNSRVIRRFGRGGQLAQLAKTGPIEGDTPTQLLGLSEKEFVSLGTVSRIIPANPDKWPMCPKPEGWGE